MSISSATSDGPQNTATSLVPRKRGIGVLIRRAAPQVLVYLVLTLLGALFALPLFWLVSSSLKAEAQVFSFPPEFIPDPVVLSNYSNAIAEFPFWGAAQNTMLIVVATVFGHVFTVSVTAFTFARMRFPGRDVLFLIVLGTLMTPYHVYLIPQYILFRNLGWINTPKPLFVPQLLAQSPYFIFLFRQFFLSIPREYDESARLDGASWFDIYWRIVMPQSLPAVGAVAIFTFMGTWNDFLAPLIYLNEPKKQTLAVALRTYEQLSMNIYLERFPWPYVMAVSVLITVPPMLLFFAAQRYFIQGVIVSGVKG